MHGPAHNSVRTKGMALVAVLWIVAALGIAVTGLIRSAKDETRQASLERSIVVASAAADAGIRLVLQDMSARPPGDVSPNWTGWVEFDGEKILIHTQSLNGVIDINHAPEALLTDLFRYVNSMPVAQATLLAQNIVQARARITATGLRAGFDAPEDLLQVPGMTYESYHEIKSLVSASLSGGGRVDPSAAPVEVLAVLAQGNTVLANKIYSDRASGNNQFDTSQLNQNFIEKSSRRIINIRAQVPLADGLLVRTWWVGLSANNAGKAPWKIIYTNNNIFPVDAK